MHMFGSALTRKDIETQLLNLYDKRSKEATIAHILHNSSQWPLQLFVNPERQNALAWYDFKRDASLLDATAEYGSMTDLFLQKCASVSLLYETKGQKNVCEQRFKDTDTTFININKLDAKTYDYIVVSDVIWTWSDIQNNFDQLLKALKPQGEIFLLMNNRLGAQFLAGLPDVHNGRLFESINTSPDNNGYATHRTLEAFLASSGLTTSFYYALPNYIFAREIFSEAQIQSPDADFSMSPLPVPAPYFSREYMFDEKAFFEHAKEEGILKSVSNSFVVIGKKSKK